MDPSLTHLLSVSPKTGYARVYFTLRFLLFRKRFSLLFAHLPSRGRIVDVGCGYGLTAHLLSLQYPNASVVGIDTNARRIQTAKTSAHEPSHLSFELADANTFSFEQGDAVLLIDVLHHIPYGQHQPLFRRLAAALGHNGVLLIADIATQPRWKYWCAYLIDVVLYPFSIRCQFYSSRSIRSMLVESGWSVQSEIRTDTGSIFPTIMYVAKPL
ncbi:MAG: class I SAM-dependent methyltransferase [Parcubacteria group bacterium]